MVSELIKVKAKVAIKTFLLANKGKKYTSNEIATFVNSNNLGLGKFGLTNVQVTLWIKSAAPNTLLGDINYERKGAATNNVWKFWV